MVTGAQTGRAGPSPIGLPTLTRAVPFSEMQWRVLMSIMDTVIPSVQKHDSKDRAAIKLTSAAYDGTVAHLRLTTVLDLSTTDEFDAFLSERPSQIPLFQDVLKRIISGLPDDKLRAFRVLLSAINNRLTTFPFTGYFTPFSQLSISDRARVLESWSSSNIPPLRMVFKQLTTIAKHVYVRTSSLLSAVSGFPSIPENWSPNSAYPFNFLQFDGHDSPLKLKTDVIVVGSGCGAGVVAKRIAASGHQVIVVDKGHYFPTSCMPFDQKEAFSHLYEQAGMVGTEDGSVNITAGSSFGGGGTINWSACLQTQGIVREEWAEEKKLKFFKSPEYQAALDRVSEEMGVSDKYIKHNHGNSTLLEGGGKLGFDTKAVPQNTNGNEHHDGHCAFGCWKGEKQGPVNGWFPDAARSEACFIEGFKVEKVLFGYTNNKKVARGVVGTWSPKRTNDTTGTHYRNQSRKVTIMAKRVVLCAGSLWSPIILLNSGLKNKQIGRNLHLHPTTFVAGVFKEDVRPWEGGILTSVVTTFDNQDGKGHGVKLERSSMMPSMCLHWLDWTSGLDYKILLSKYRHMEFLIAITRDRDSGFILPDPVSGNPRVTYTPSKFDRDHNMTGMVALARILYVQGALEIHPALPGFRPFIRDVEELEGNTASGDLDKRFQKWLNSMKAHGNKAPETPFASAHQMSSCSMSSRKEDGVVDEYGKVWDCEGLYVADASVLPSASGVNPMITIMAICDRISWGIVEGLARDTVTSAKI